MFTQNIEIVFFIFLLSNFDIFISSGNSKNLFYMKISTSYPSILIFPFLSPNTSRLSLSSSINLLSFTAHFSLFLYVLLSPNFPLYLFLSPFLPVSVCLSVCLSVSPSVSLFLSVSLSFSVSLCLFLLSRADSFSFSSYSLSSSASFCLLLSLFFSLTLTHTHTHTHTYYSVHSGLT